MMNYDEVIAEKSRLEHPAGFEISESDLNNKLFPFQKAIVKWALKRGKSGIFADTGLGKTFMQLEWAYHVNQHTGGNILIFAPLCVAFQTIDEGKKLDIDIHYCRQQSDIKEGINITNYEMLDHFSISEFVGVVLDESSIIKHQSSKIRTKIINECIATPYKLSCTATPSPNDHMELGNQSEFLGIMLGVEMLATYFIHDGGETSKWRLKGHGASKFWEWLATWAVYIRKPSDLGFDDDGYDLPPLVFNETVIETKATDGNLFAEPAEGLLGRNRARKESTDLRVQACADIVNKSSDSFIVWCHLNDESAKLKALIPDSKDVKGADSIEYKQQTLKDFTDGKLRVIISKPSIAGFGMNWQHCHNMAFVGLNDSWEQFYQAIRRCYRFGQKKSVTVNIISADTEALTTDNIKRKELQSEKLHKEVVKYMSTFMQTNIKHLKRDKMEYQEDLKEGENYKMYKGDCVKTIAKIEDESIDYTIFSPPFSSLYTYSNSDYDMGNCNNHSSFFKQFKFLVSELLRVTAKGRLLSFHCMNLPTSKQRDGVIGLTDFRGELIRMFTDAGWVYHSEVCIWKDPVIAMQRTKALGLLHKQVKKDSCMSRQGLPDYLVTMRKLGENIKPVSHDNESYPVGIWQQIASPIWMDINPSDTLQFRTARENNDERHICPLQLQVIERAMGLWTTEGDTVLSPFAGIGSEGFVANQTGRKFVGIELKDSYWKLACKNLESAKKKQLSLLG